jgi:flagellar motor switch protein FliN/FliY
MAPKTAKSEDPMEIGDNNAELDQAIDDLRGVLKADADGTAVPEGDFASDFPETPSSMEDFGGTGFESDLPAADSPFGASSDFGGGGGDFGGGSDFGNEFGGGDSFGETSFGGALGHDGGHQAAASEPGSGMHANMDLIMDIPIDVQIILGSSRMQVSGLMNLTEGAIISLDRRIGEPVDLMVNGRLIGRGEITVMDNDETRFGIRLLEVKSVAKS